MCANAVNPGWPPKRSLNSQNQNMLRFLFILEEQRWENVRISHILMISPVFWSSWCTLMQIIVHHFQRHAHYSALLYMFLTTLATIRLHKTTLQTMWLALDTDTVCADFAIEVNGDWIKCGKKEHALQNGWNKMVSTLSESQRCLKCVKPEVLCFRNIISF